MFDISKSDFLKPQQASVPADCDIVFVSDMFADEYAGGAELTTQALIDASPLKVHKVKSRDVTMQLLSSGIEKFWIFGNFAQMDPNLIPSIVGNMDYSVIEFDYKYCAHRSPEKHENSSGTKCGCHNEVHGKLISAFYHGSRCLFWMSEEQKNVYTSVFPFLSSNNNIVVSSIFSPETLAYIEQLREEYKDVEKTHWFVLKSPSWIKGYEDAVKWCETNNVEHHDIWNLSYDETLRKLAQSKGHVYLPRGKDTCPRLTIEAKLLGLELHVNDNVQHANEDWFTGSDEITKTYLLGSPGLFWSAIKTQMEYRPSISGYTTTLNCVDQGYPLDECIQSMLEFCDEVCVVDGGSTDDTTHNLLAMQLKNLTTPDGSYTFNDDGFVNESRLKVKIVSRDWNSPRFAVFDGMQKAEARAMCTKEFCWQMDSDEVVHEDDVNEILHITKNMPKGVSLIALPVIEYWGNASKVRMDVTPWKWRLSRNDPNITHGIPSSLRRVDSNGDTYAKQGTDGCDYIYTNSFEPVPFVNFYNAQVEAARAAALNGNIQAHVAYEQWFKSVTESLPSVYHYSWFDLKRKIKLYRDYWSKHWSSLYSEDPSSVTDENMMFDVPWSDVTDEMIDDLAEQLSKTGGHIWHSKWDGSVTPWLTMQKQQPKFMMDKLMKKMELK